MKNKTYGKEKMRIDQTKQTTVLRIKNHILSNVFNEKYGLKLWENVTTELGLKGLKLTCLFSEELKWVFFAALEHS